MKIQRKVIVEGTVKEVKSGNSDKNKKWYLIKLEQGKGTENIFVDGIDKNVGISKFADLIGKEVAISGELWRDKANDYNLKYAKMKVTTVINNDDDIPFN